jgi:hypothetical protein
MHKKMCISPYPEIADLHPFFGALFSGQRSEFIGPTLDTFFQLHPSS